MATIETVQELEEKVMDHFEIGREEVLESELLPRQELPGMLMNPHEVVSSETDFEQSPVLNGNC